MSRMILSRALPLALTGLLATASIASAQLARGFTQDPSAAPAGAYRLDKSHTSVTAQVVHLGLSNFSMRLKGVSGDLTYDPQDPTRSKVDVSIDPASVDTGAPALDQEVTQAFKGSPIRFVSTGIERTGPTSGKLTGDLTFNGVTRPVVLDARFNGTGGGAGGAHARIGFSATGAIKRSDFGFTAFSTWAGDDVVLHIETEFSQ